MVKHHIGELSMCSNSGTSPRQYAEPVKMSTLLTDIFGLYLPPHCNYCSAIPTSCELSSHNSSHFQINVLWKLQVVINACYLCFDNLLMQDWTGIMSILFHVFRFQICLKIKTCLLDILLLCLICHVLWISKLWDVVIEMYMFQLNCCLLCLSLLLVNRSKLIQTICSIFHSTSLPSGVAWPIFVCKMMMTRHTHLKICYL